MLNSRVYEGAGVAGGLSGLEMRNEGGGRKGSASGASPLVKPHSLVDLSPSKGLRETSTAFLKGQACRRQAPRVREQSHMGQVGQQAALKL